MSAAAMPATVPSRRTLSKAVRAVGSVSTFGSIAKIVSYLSTFLSLEPGDVIATGTPQGIGAKRTPPVWLAAGDVVEVDVDRVGLLRNSVAAL